ncbi:hypothetical protein ABEB36_002316 [Hypothenemus hampei]|uniref:Uncharacterized protein n=1 Tax=Hypothenemus hampei TaxID=57062 RepID=A0ABD1F5A9_HYPHA
MATRVRHIDPDQENAPKVNVVKPTVILNKETKSNRTFGGDRKNTIQNENKPGTGKVMGPPKDVPLKKEVIKKVHPPASNNKENIFGQTINKSINDKLIRQESLQLKSKLNDLKLKTTTTTTTKSNQLVYDPDLKDKEDPQLVAEYIVEILSYVRNAEDEFPIQENFLNETKVSYKMRSTLINWLIEVHQNFNLELDTLHLCISIVDRYCQGNKNVERNIYQLIGTAALMVACKYEEIYLPDISDFVYVSDNAFTKKQLFEMELDIVKKLDFRVNYPISIFFLRRYNRIAVVKAEQHSLGKYILELALLEYNLAHVKPSMIAAATCCLAIAVINEVMEPRRCWTPTLTYYTNYKYSDFKDILVELAHVIVKAESSKYTIAREKYSSAKYQKISLNFKLKGPLIRKLTPSQKAVCNK